MRYWAYPQDTVAPLWRERDHRLLPMVKSLKLDLTEVQRVVCFDAKLSDGAFELRGVEQNPDCTKIARLLVNLCRLGSSHRVGAICAGIEPD